MRLVDKLLSQHLGWGFKNYWATQSRRNPSNSGAEKDLQGDGIFIKASKDVLQERLSHIHISSSKTGLNSSAYQSTVWKDRSSPSKPCYIYGNNNVLIGGLQQALKLTKSFEIRGLPKSIENIEVRITTSMEANIKEAIMTSNMLFADQVKLLKPKPSRPRTHNLPQDYNISNGRKISSLIYKLLTECEQNAGRDINSQRRLLDLMNFKVAVPKRDGLLQFEVDEGKMITSNRPLATIESHYDTNVPELHHIRDTISLPKQCMYSADDIYSLHSNCCHPHTVFLYFDKNYLKNIHDGDANTSQFQSRNLLIAFGVAAARAKQIYGDMALNDLPKPIVVQSIQTDGRTFHFGVFQLNSLQIDHSESPRNYWFHKPNEDLFETCKYSSGRPSLVGLNKNVFRYICAFYKNS
ncbi:large ribosomal subunit protein mL37 isoform X1 [Eurosta solidaginis]|uniref:large ribosomal subunit protein mL37 isoform X1 n=1 Tax=Eurosta solidaginis TaxID=178769 RepID=UPI003530AC48